MGTILGPTALSLLLILTSWITIAALINVWRHNLRPLLLLAIGSGMLALTFGFRLVANNPEDGWTALAALTQLLGLVCIVGYGRSFSSTLRKRGFGWRQLLFFAPF